MAARFRRGATAARLTGIVGSNPTGACMSVYCECCVLSGRGLCDGPITHPEESDGMWCVWVWSWNFDNEEDLVHWGTVLTIPGAANLEGLVRHKIRLKAANISMWKTLFIHSKGKSVPLQAWSGPEGTRKLRFPDFMTTAQDSGKVISLKHRAPLPPGNNPGTHFC